MERLVNLHDGLGIHLVPCLVAIIGKSFAEPGRVSAYEFKSALGMQRHYAADMDVFSRSPRGLPGTYLMWMCCAAPYTIQCEKEGPIGPEKRRKLTRRNVKKDADCESFGVIVLSSRCDDPSLSEFLPFSSQTEKVARLIAKSVSIL